MKIPSFTKISAMVRKLKRGSVSILKIINGQSSVNTVDGIKGFSFALLSDGGLYFYQAS